MGNTEIDEDIFEDLSDTLLDDDSFVSSTKRCDSNAVEGGENDSDEDSDEDCILQRNKTLRDLSSKLMESRNRKQRRNNSYSQSRRNLFAKKPRTVTFADKVLLIFTCALCLRFVHIYI